MGVGWGHEDRAGEVGVWGYLRFWHLKGAVEDLRLRGVIWSSGPRSGPRIPDTRLQGWHRFGMQGFSLSGF